MSRTFGTFTNSLVAALLVMPAVAAERMNKVPPPGEEILVPAPSYRLDSGTGATEEKLLRRNDGVATPGMNVHVRPLGERMYPAMTMERYQDLLSIGPYDSDAREAYFVPNGPAGNEQFNAAQARRDHDERTRRNQQEVPPPPAPVPQTIIIDRRRTEAPRWDTSWSLGYGAPLSYYRAGRYDRGWSSRCASHYSLGYDSRHGWHPGFGLNCW